MPGLTDGVWLSVGEVAPAVGIPGKGVPIIMVAFGSGFATFPTTGFPGAEFERSCPCEAVPRAGGMLTRLSEDPHETQSVAVSLFSLPHCGQNMLIVFPMAWVLQVTQVLGRRMPDLPKKATHKTSVTKIGSSFGTWGFRRCLDLDRSIHRA